ncbi:type II toxin-antitoxin system HipA family toxin [Azotobacter salinestris]|uniref:type II toxin-antitoxin system HipA family toxin n=1 Tax=Azotobacter salinestris TaxID=69964 RepID=UPI0032DFD9AD
MTSNKQTLLVHAYLPGASVPVPAGKLNLIEAQTRVESCSFVYGLRYLSRRGSLEVDPVGLGFLQGQSVRGRELFPESLPLFGGIRDAAPDAWGRRVIEAKLKVPANSLAESVYLLEAGGNRVGALEITQDGAQPKGPTQTDGLRRLHYLLEAVERIEQGFPVPANLHEIFEAGSSMGGMRPKATLIDDQGRHWLAKFPSLGDRGFNVPRVERATLELARAAGLRVPATGLHEIGSGRTCMLIERFDRTGQAEAVGRRHYITGLTLMNLHETESITSSYAALADAMRRHLSAESLREDLVELFGRMVFNILVNNDDDHLRNHGFVLIEHPAQVPQVGLQEPAQAVRLAWRLSPLYDVVPRPSLSQSRRLHLGVGQYGREASLPNALSWSERFGLPRAAAIAVIERIWSAVREWKGQFEAAGATGDDIDGISPAFLHARELGGREVGLG